MSDSLTIVPLEPSTPLELVTGRVTQLSFGDEVSSVRLLDQPDFGRVTVNPDGSVALVMSDTDQVGRISFTAELTLGDGSTRTVETEIDLVQGKQAAGWGLGDFYQLATDAGDLSVVEHGDNHRKIHISGSDAALSLSDIAAREGLSEKDITGAWLAQHAEYGGSPDLALDEDAGAVLWKAVAAEGPSSNWLLFEKGYTYQDTLDVTNVHGENALHPVLISSYGSAGEAILGGEIKGIKNNIGNIVFQDLNLTGDVTLLSGKNILLEDINTSNKLNLQNMDALTVRHSSSIDAYHAESQKTDGIWNQSPDRMSGIFVKNTDGVLIEDNLFDHAGWGEGYDYDLSEDAPQPPSFYNHNVYVQRDNTDVTFRDNISMRGASFGAQIRSGGFIEDNVFIDNNAGVNFFGGGMGSATGIRPGNYTLFHSNLVTSAGYKEVSQNQGALSMGVNYGGNLSSLIDNIVAHLADPANPEEQRDKYVAHAASNGPETYYDDTIVYNWIGQKDIVYADRHGKDPKNPDQNVDGLDSAVLDQTTIQKFAAQLLGQDSATIDDLANFLRAQTRGELDHVADADLILAFFQEGFGLTADLDASAGQQRFVPNALGDGLRWDNRLNWDQGYVPTEGQDIDLGSNRVYYAGAGTVGIGDLDLGDGGSLITSAGKLSVTGTLSAGETGGAIKIANAGQVWLAGYADLDPLTLEITGGRFANQGAVTGTITMNVSGGQVLLVAGSGSFDLGAGSLIEITGDDARIGFDGTAGAVAAMQIDAGATLSFIADETGVSTIEEFRSGAYGETPLDSQSSIALGGNLALDLSVLGSGVTSLTLIAADEITGDFQDITVTGLGSGRDATFFVDYAADTVTLRLSAGTGQVIRMIEDGEGAPEPADPTPSIPSEPGDQGELEQAIPDQPDTGEGQTDPVTPPETLPDLPGDLPSGESVTEVFADGRERTTWFSDGIRSARIERDLLDRKNWVEWRAEFDENGELTRKSQTFDDGREVLTEYSHGIRTSETRTDPTDVRHWESSTSSFDAAGRISDILQQMDDGREVLTRYDDGQTVMITGADVADSFIWKASGQSFDQHGDLIADLRIFDDGAIQLRDGADGEVMQIASYDDLSLTQKLLVDQFDFV
jgi:hypothetical protein